MKLSELESKLGVKFPKKWHEIYDTGAMEWIELSGEEFRENRGRYINDSKAFLLFGCECEPLLFDEIPEYLDELKEWISRRTEDDGAVLKEGLTLIPFGHNAGGDLYCFLYDGDLNSEPKIILYIHDCYEDWYDKWNSLDELLYECMLKAVDPEFGCDIDNGGWQAHLDYLTGENRARLIGRTAEDLYDEFLGSPQGPENFAFIWDKPTD